MNRRLEGEEPALGGRLASRHAPPAIHSPSHPWHLVKEGKGVWQECHPEDIQRPADVAQWGLGTVSGCGILPYILRLSRWTPQAVTQGLAENSARTLTRLQPEPWRGREELRGTAQSSCRHTARPLQSKRRSREGQPRGPAAAIDCWPHQDED